jgi:hypothetical protein
MKNETLLIDLKLLNDSKIEKIKLKKLMEERL